MGFIVSNLIKETQDLDGFNSEFCKLKAEAVPIIHNFFPESKKQSNTS